MAETHSNGYVYDKLLVKKFSWWWPYQKLYSRYHACRAALRLVKFREVKSTNPIGIGTTC